MKKERQNVVDGMRSSIELIFIIRKYNLHNRGDNINHISNEMWIDEEDGRHHHLASIRPTVRSCLA
jgi:hypothetical protein